MRRLILTGEIGTGKSTLIHKSLGADARRAGGFITRRVFEGHILKGYELAAAAALAESDMTGDFFLTLSPSVQRRDWVFAESGAALLQKAQNAPFAVADEFGGLELLVDPFYEQLLALLRSDVPVIGVMKTDLSVRALSEKIPLGDLYAQRAQSLRAMLESDPETVILPFFHWDDPMAIQMITDWANAHVRR